MKKRKFYFFIILQVLLASCGGSSSKKSLSGSADSTSRLFSDTTTTSHKANKAYDAAVMPNIDSAFYPTSKKLIQSNSKSDSYIQTPNYRSTYPVPKFPITVVPAIKRPPNLQELINSSFSDKNAKVIRLNTLKKAKKEWQAIYSNCRIASDDYDLKKFDFLGVGSPKTIGHLIDSLEIISRMPMDSSIFTSEELQKIISQGNYVRCKIGTSKSLALNSLFNGELKCDSLGSELKGALENSFSQKKNLAINVDSWRKIELNSTWLLHYLRKESPNNENKKIFYEALKQQGTLIIVSAIYVKGFSIDITLDKLLSLEGQNELKQTRECKIGGMKFKLSLKTASSKTVSIQSEEEFIVFGRLLSTKSIR